MQRSELMYLPVNWLHVWAVDHIIKFQKGGGTGYINEAINLDREALELCPPGHPK